MTNTSKTILFFGTEEFSATSLQALIDHGYTIGAVITKPDSKKGRGQKLIPPTVKVIAEHHAIPVWQPNKLTDITHDIASLKAPIGVLVSYGKLIPGTIIDLFEPGIINVHPSLLPRYRGPSPIETAILNGDTATGVSLMQLVTAMDAGPVYSQITVPLTGRETAPQLEQQLAVLGGELLCQSLPAIMNGQLTPTPQQEAAASYSHLLQKQDGLLDPTQADATTLERAIRAFQTYPKARLPFHGTSVIVTKAHVTTTTDETTIRCANATILAIDQLIAPSGKQMTTQAYLRGHHTSH